MQALREAPGYLGAWPSPGYTDWMPALGREPDPFGYTYSRLLKLWKLQWGQFSVMSFDQQRLESLKPHLKIADRERPAQIRLEVGDLVNSNLRNWANSVNYRRAWQTSVANVRLLNLLSQQFRVTPESARLIVERMLGVELVCSLGGEYRLAELPEGRKVWYSTAWPSFSRPEIPPGHTAPLLKWFRGLEIEVSKGPSVTKSKPNFPRLTCSKVSPIFWAAETKRTGKSLTTNSRHRILIRSRPWLVPRAGASPSRKKRRCQI